MLHLREVNLQCPFTAGLEFEVGGREPDAGVTGSVDFGAIYSANLVYVPECWRPCGDAHCCSFARHKARFRLIGGKGQELPLLPGEFEFLRDSGRLKHFGSHEHRVIEYAFGTRKLRIETLVARGEGCQCVHGARPTICRLYPFMPSFDLDGRLVGMSRVGIYDMLEELDGLERICKVNGLPPDQAEAFMKIANAISSSPSALFYVAAYALAHEHARERLIGLRGERSTSFFTLFENAVLRGILFCAKSSMRSCWRWPIPSRCATARSSSRIDHPDFSAAPAFRSCSNATPGRLLAQ